jgi:hypothetical protein
LSRRSGAPCGCSYGCFATSGGCGVPSLLSASASAQPSTQPGCNNHTGNRVWVKIRISPRQSVDDDFKPSRSFSATDRFEFDVTYTLGVPPPAAAMMDPL